jgi:hypothetical protein
VRSAEQLTMANSTDRLKHLKELLLIERKEDYYQYRKNAFPQITLMTQIKTNTKHIQIG